MPTFSLSFLCVLVQNSVRQDLPRSHSTSICSIVRNVVSIVRAFEVEHTTSVYSGILRMADLLALQPNMDIVVQWQAIKDTLLFLFPFTKHAGPICPRNPNCHPHTRADLGNQGLHTN